MQAAAAAPTEQTIVPPVNSTFVDLFLIDNQGTVELIWNGTVGEKIELNYDSGWEPGTCALVFQVPAGWTLDPKVIATSPFAWSSSGNVWTAQVLNATIKAAINGVTTDFAFTFIEPSSGRRHDPRIIVEREN